MTHDVTQLVAWLYANYDARTVAGQPGYEDARCRAVMQYCNASRRLASGKGNAADRARWQAAMDAALPHLPQV